MASDRPKAEALLAAALDIVTPDVQGQLDTMTTDEADTERRILERQLRDATECSYYLSRQYITQALRRRRGERLPLPRQGGYRPENAGDNQWKRRAMATKTDKTGETKSGA